ncbi:MAG: Lrp/AsnC family transcriptional regulator [Nanoarchaeota archaeon]
MTEITKYSEIEPVKLDLKDKKLLYEIDFNSRQSYQQLAKKIGLSKQGVEYKLNNLIKKGVIKGFYPVINVPKLGYLYCRLLVTLQNITLKDREKIINYLINHKKIFWLFYMQGMYDLIMVIWAKNVSEFKDFIEEFESNYGSFIKRKVETIMTDVIHLKHRFLLGIKEIEEIHIKETDERIKIDDKDKFILNLLSKNPRMSLVDMSKEIKESPKVIAYRIKNLEKQKLIEAYRPIIDYNKLGYTYYKVFINLYKTSKEELLKLREYIKLNPLVIYFIEGVGLPSDLDIEIVIKSNQELFNFIEDLKFKFPKLISDYNTVIFIDTLKVRYLPY